MLLQNRLLTFDDFRTGIFCAPVQNWIGRLACWLVAIWLVSLTRGHVSAHEGHQPLPTKGVQVDTLHGHVTLSHQARNALGLETQEVVEGTVSSTLKVYAEATAPWHAKAFGSAQISGRIAKLLVRPGDSVLKDQVVAQLSSRDLESVKLDYLQAQKDLALNQRLLAMTQPTAQAGAVPMQRLLDLENAVAQNEGRLEISRVRARALGIALDDTRLDESSHILYAIRSPIAGQIVHSDLAEGKFVEPFEHLFEIVNTEQTWVRLQLLQKDVFNVTLGQHVDMMFLNDTITVSGDIDRIDANLDAQTQTSWAWVTISHPMVVPGLVGKATIQTSTHGAKLTVPSSAVYSDGLQTYVFVEEATTRSSAEYRKKNVRLGQRQLASAESKAAMVEVLQGDIYPGDRVVVQGGHELSSLFFLGVLKLSAADRQLLGVTTTAAELREVADSIQLPAAITLAPEDRAVLSSQLDGTLYSHTLSPGRDVQAGELLMGIASPGFYKLQLELLTTSLDAELARSRANRLAELKGEAISQRIALETRVQAEQLETRVLSLKRQLSTLGLSPGEIDSITTERKTLDYLPVRAPINGKIATSSVTLGESVVANQALVEIHNLNSVWLEAHIPALQVKATSTATTGLATILANSDIRLPVVVSRRSPVVNESTRTQSVWFTLESSRKSPMLRAGSLASVTVPLSNGTSRLAVPASAILRDGVHFLAFVQRPDDYIERRRVTVGRSDGEYVEIISGVKAGELVVSTGGRELQTAYASLR